MTDNTEAKSVYAVVYQIGKVGSTSIVATLDELPGFTAVQSHFLGEDILKDIIPTITNADVTSYFFKHQLGQFIDNMHVTRQINMIRAGKTPNRLMIISLSRDPLEWFRSSLVQDMEGYAPILHNFGLKNGVPEGAESDVIEGALEKFAEKAADVIETTDGVDALVRTLETTGAGAFRGTAFQGNVQTQKIFRMMLRPFNWFDKHFAVSLGLTLEQMEKTDLGLEYSDDIADYVVLRYEDIATTLRAYLEKMDLPVYDELLRKNDSTSKQFADETKRAMKSASGQRLNALFAQSRYSRAFGY
ncbi:MAG: hypothetical protein ABJZ79_00025 [Parasphingorhabdus sp.]|uniref:hypothetical protein n=1 Tax=Parasphingorhabdus sp. TaxID=2709688 RepID=UPI003299A327